MLSDEYKLDSDYITTHLGELNPMEECSIIQLAKRMKQTFEKVCQLSLRTELFPSRHFTARSFFLKHFTALSESGFGLGLVSYGCSEGYGLSLKAFLSI